MDTLEDRLVALDRVLSDPPVIHPNAPGGVWQTSPDAYRFLARHCASGARTLETGLGVSTVLFALWGTEHCCITPESTEVARCLEYCRSRDISVDRVRFEIGYSASVLPTLTLDELDLYLIDGAHAFPQPAIDWFYGAGWLRSGATLIVDDLQLPAVKHLSWFLDLDPRWINLDRTQKWAAYRRDGHWPLSESWAKQPFFKEPAAPEETIKQQARRIAGRLYRSVRPRKPAS